jgi:hypothetical protein
MARKFGVVPLRLAVGSALALTGMAFLAAPASAATNTTTAVTESAGAVTGAPVTFTATVTHGATGVPTGNVVFTVTGMDAAPFTCDGGNTATLAPNGSGPGSVATCSFSGGLQASDSNYAVTATYAGDGTFNGSNGSLSAKISRASTTTAVLSSSNPTVTGQSVTFSATVAPTSPATGSPTGSVTFAINGTGGGSVACDTTGDTVPLSGGSASCTISAGLLAQFSPYAVSAAYSGDSNYRPSAGNVSQTVSKAAVTLGLTSSLASPVDGQAISFTASITSVTPPGAGTPSGDIVFSVMGNNVLPGQPGFTATCDGGDTQPLSGGSATCSFAGGLLSNPLTYTVTATLKDANFHAAATASLIQPVNKASTSTTVTGAPDRLYASQGFTFTVTIQTLAPGGGVPTGNLEWAVCNHNMPTCSGLPGGTFILPKPKAGDIAHNRQVIHYTVPGGMPPGFYSLNATFSGDSDYQNSASSTGFILVNKVPTSMQIVLQKNPLFQGSNMGIKVAVIPNSAASGSLGAPQGTVSFTVTGAEGDTVNCDSGSNVITISTTSSNQGRAVCTIPAGDISAADGPYEVQAQYSGDSNYDSVDGSQTVHVVLP